MRIHPDSTSSTSSTSSTAGTISSTAGTISSTGTDEISSRRNLTRNLTCHLTRHLTRHLTCNLTRILTHGLGRKAFVATLAATLLTSPILPAQSIYQTAYAAATAATPQQPTVALLGEQPVTAGATLKKYVWKSARNNTAVSANANVIVIDLQNPYVRLDVMTGKNGQFTTRQTVKGMAKETGAVAGVNGDYYNVSGEGAPIGGQISEGRIMSSPSYLNGMYAFALTKDNKPIIDTFTFSGTIASANGQTSYPLAGVNKTTYWRDPDKKHSHQDALYIYTGVWGGKDRAGDGATVPTEVLVQDGRITQISDKKALDMLPPADGYILRASGKAATFILQNFKVGDPIYADYKLVPVDPAKSYDTAGFQMMIGGHTILVDNGAPAKFSRDVSSLGGYRSRTGLGISQDGRYVYIITVDLGGDSKGMSLSEFQKFMVNVGVWKGLNLDGGGSTQMVARPLGDTEVVLANTTEYSTARQVVNGLGVYTIAPQGNLSGLLIQSEEEMFINEKKTLKLKAYDEYYNPITIDPSVVSWAASSAIGKFDGAEFTAMKPGTITVTASASGGIRQTKEIGIVGRKDINSMVFQTGDFVVSEGESYELPVVVVTMKGVKRTIPPELLQWEFDGFDGVVKGSTVTVTRLEGNVLGRIIARYDGFSTMLTKSVGVDKLFDDFDATTHAITKQTTPAEVLAAIRPLSGLMPGQPDNAALTFDYNFKLGAGTKAAYAAFGDGGAGIAIEGKPSRVKMNVMGDAALNWLRAEFTDANNKSYLVDIANPVDWYGWKKVSVDLETYKMAYPIKLKRIYVASPELGQDEREATGFMAVDDISFQYKGEVPATPKAKVQMAVGRTSLTVNGERQKLETAPVIEGGSTLIPIRFFVEAMGGETKWDNAARRVSIIRDNHLIEMWIDDRAVVIDGTLAQSPVAPKLMKKRTMVPLRLISEALGWKVGWDQTTKSITLE